MSQLFSSAKNQRLSKMSLLSPSKTKERIYQIILMQVVSSNNRLSNKINGKTSVAIVLNVWNGMRSKQKHKHIAQQIKLSKNCDTIYTNYINQVNGKKGSPFFYILKTRSLKYGMSSELSIYF